MFLINPSHISKNTTKDYLDQKTSVNSYKIENVPILNQLDYKNMSEKFSISYTQVYTLVRKYKIDGESYENI